MAQSFAENIGLESMSAGTMPSKQINPIVVEAMKEKGIDIFTRMPKLLTAEMINDAALVITMGCSVSEVCPKPMLAQMQKKLVDWSLEDPSGQSIEKVREIRDKIEEKVMELKDSMIAS